MVFSNLDYVCKENGRCVVDVTRRNQCQACRFSKCLRVNMKKDGKLQQYPKKKILSGCVSIATLYLYSMIVKLQTMVCSVDSLIFTYCGTTFRGKFIAIHLP